MAERDEQELTEAVKKLIADGLRDAPGVQDLVEICAAWDEANQVYQETLLHYTTGVSTVSASSVPIC